MGEFFFSDSPCLSPVICESRLFDRGYFVDCVFNAAFRFAATWSLTMTIKEFGGDRPAKYHLCMIVRHLFLIVTHLSLHSLSLHQEYELD